MIYKLKLTDRLYDDLEAVLDWYKNILAHLDDEFIQEFYSTIDILKTSPLIYQIQFGDVRRVNLDRFPYVVYYEVQGKTVVVIGLYHSKQNPKTMLANINNRRQSLF